MFHDNLKAKLNLRNSMILAQEGTIEIKKNPKAKLSKVTVSKSLIITINNLKLLKLLKLMLVKRKVNNYYSKNSIRPHSKGPNVFDDVSGVTTWSGNF